MTQRTRLGVVSFFVAAALVSVFMLTASAQKAPAAAPPPKGPAVVAVATLQTLMPQLDTWTRGPLGGSVVLISEESGYSFAEADFTSGDMKVRLTVGDTIGVDDCLLALAAMVVVLPEGYSEKLPPATSISRFTFSGFQAASKWDSEKQKGEFSVVVNGRFVVKAEGTQLDSVDTLRNIVSKIDLQKLSELKAGK